MTLGALLNASVAGSAAGAGAAPAPEVVVEEDEVIVRHSYPVKDQLRALGFRWDAARVVWASPLKRVLARLAAACCGVEVTLDALLAAAAANGGGS